MDTNIKQRGAADAVAIFKKTGMENCKKCVFFSGDHCKRNFKHYSDNCFFSMEIFCCGCKYYDKQQKVRFCVNPEQEFLKGDYFCKTFSKQY